MTVDGYNRFCRSLSATSHVVQWGGAHVWKVAGKVFAIAWFDANDRGDDDELLVTFKVSPMSFELLKEMPGCRPAPYLASRGMKWIQRTTSETLDDAGLRDYIIESHRIVALGLPKRVQKELGIGAEAKASRPGTKPNKAATATRRAPSKSSKPKSKSPKSKPQRAREASRGEAP